MNALLRLVSSSSLIGASWLMMMTSGCKTTSPATGTALKNTDRGEIPALMLHKVDKEMLERVIAWARSDAEAMFGGVAYFHTLAFDDISTKGPCQSVLGARILFANSDRNPGGDRPYAMVALNPTFNGEKCVYGSQSVTKMESDVKWLVAGTRNLEQNGGTRDIALTLGDALNRVKKSYSTFQAPTVVSIIASDVPGMDKSPWAMMSGTACGQDVVAYVNLVSGDVLAGQRPIKTKC